MTMPKREVETGTDLWRMILSPTVWSVHFLVCYIAAAVYCEKAGRDADLGPVQWAVVVATIVALVVIGLNTASLWFGRAPSLTDADLDYEHNTPEERHRFLNHAALMLSAVSAIGILFVALPAGLLGTCR